MGKFRGKKLFAVLCAMCFFTVAGCGSNGSAASTSNGKPAAGGSITVYGWSGDWDLWFKTWGKMFKDQTGISLKYVSGDGTAMRQRITAEKASKSDIFVGTPSDNFTLAQQGLLANIPWNKLSDNNAISPKFKTSQVGIWGYDMELIAYNKKYLNASDAPTSWEALADPKWKGKLGLNDPTQEGATRAALVMIKKYGHSQAMNLETQMYKNAKLTYTTPGAEESALASGSVQVEDTSMGSVMVMQKQAGASIGTVVPSEGAFLLLNSISMMKNAPNPTGALDFIKFFYSNQMQNIIQNQLGISIAVDSNVKVTNKSLSGALGGEAPAQVLKTAYVPDWSTLIKQNSSGQSQLSTLYTDLDAAAKKK